MKPKISSKYFEKAHPSILLKIFGSRIQGRQLVTTFRVPSTFTRQDIKQLVKKAVKIYNLKSIPSQPKINISIHTLPDKKKEISISLDYNYKFTQLCQSINFLLSSSKEEALIYLGTNKEMVKILNTLTSLYNDYLNEVQNDTRLRNNE